MTICVIVPCFCYGAIALEAYRNEKRMVNKMDVAEMLAVSTTCGFGIVLACVGTYGSIIRIHQAGG